MGGPRGGLLLLRQALPRLLLSSSFAQRVAASGWLHAGSARGGGRVRVPPRHYLGADVHTYPVAKGHKDRACGASSTGRIVGQLPHDRAATSLRKPVGGHRKTPRRWSSLSRGDPPRHLRPSASDQDLRRIAPTPRSISVLCLRLHRASRSIYAARRRFAASQIRSRLFDALQVGGLTA
jgi:hypothetical protein